jgi:hypothetical protein
MADQLGKEAQRSERPDQRTTVTQLDEIGGHQRVPGAIGVYVDDDGDGVGDVIDRKELVRELELAHHLVLLRPSWSRGSVIMRISRHRVLPRQSLLR